MYSTEYDGPVLSDHIKIIMQGVVIAECFCGRHEDHPAHQ